METHRFTTKDVEHYLESLNPVTLDEVEAMLNQLDRMWHWEIAGKGRFSVLKLIDRKCNRLYWQAKKIVGHGTAGV